MRPLIDEEPEEILDMEHQAMAVFRRARDQVHMVRQARIYFNNTKAEPSPAAKAERAERLKEMMKTVPCRK